MKRTVVRDLFEELLYRLQFGRIHIGKVPHRHADRASLEIDCEKQYGDRVPSVSHDSQ
jgi:hypothetical protein